MRKSILGFAAAVILAMTLLQVASPARADDIPCEDGRWGCTRYYIGQLSSPEEWQGIKGYIQPGSPTLASWLNSVASFVNIAGPRGWWVQSGTVMGLGPSEGSYPGDDPPAWPEGVIYGAPTMYVENFAPCDWYHFYTYGGYGSGVGNHEYQMEPNGAHYPQQCFIDGHIETVETYLFEFRIDGALERLGALGISPWGTAIAQTELHNYTEILEDAGINYFGTDGSGGGSLDFGLHVFDGSDWRCWSTGVCDAGHPRIISQTEFREWGRDGGGVPPYQYDRLNPSMSDFYSFKSWGRPGDVDYDGTQDPEDPEDDNDSLGVGDPLRFRDTVEDFIGTRYQDPCSDDDRLEHPPHPPNVWWPAYPSPPYDAWPPDLNQDRAVNILDVLLFKGKLQHCWPDDPEYNQRFDLDASLCVNILDVLIMKLYINASCP